MSHELDENTLRRRQHAAGYGVPDICAVAVEIGLLPIGSSLSTHEKAIMLTEDGALRVICRWYTELTAELLFRKAEASPRVVDVTLEKVG